MQFNVLRELRQPIGSVNEYDVEERRLRIDDVELAGLKGTVTLLRTDRGLLATVKAAATMQEKCARCLADAECAVAMEFAEEYLPVVDANTGARQRVSEAGDPFRIGPDFVLDLREGIRQYFLMSEPLKPLCRTDCAGLCPNCGANLNASPCGCKAETDERWAALAGQNVDKSEGS